MDTTSPTFWRAPNQAMSATYATSPYTMAPMSATIHSQNSDQHYQYSTPDSGFQWQPHIPMRPMAVKNTGDFSHQYENQYPQHTFPTFERRMTLPSDMHDVPSMPTEYTSSSSDLHSTPIAPPFSDPVHSYHHLQNELPSAWGAAQTVQGPQIAVSGPEAYNQGWFTTSQGLADVKEEDDVLHILPSQALRHDRQHYQNNPG